jgi:hypothetical protein
MKSYCIGKKKETEGGGERGDERRTSLDCSKPHSTPATASKKGKGGAMGLPAVLVAVHFVYKT